MSWFNNKIIAKKSEFFKGTNIFDQLNNSVFGKIKNILYELFGEDDINEYKLPTVIVIGNESSGKSCLFRKYYKVSIIPQRY